MAYWHEDGYGRTWWGPLYGNARKAWNCAECGSYIGVGDYFARFEPGGVNTEGNRYTIRVCADCDRFPSNP